MASAFSASPSVSRRLDRKSTRLNSSHSQISYAVFCLKNNRPAIAVVLPAKRGPSVLIDSGANADGRAEHLRQFAHMGSVFAQEILGISDPEVRLLSIGEEPEKGNQLTLEAHRLLSEAEDLNFRGNTESRNLLEGAADVVVCDGFTGNVVLKALEGTIATVLGSLREEISASRRAKRSEERRVGKECRSRWSPYH